MEAVKTTPAPRRAPRPRPEAGARYIYGVVRASERPLQLGPIGISGGEVHTIDSAGLSAVVSQLTIQGPILALRKNLAPHHQVLMEVMKGQTILPLRFGHLATSPRAVAQFLDQHAERFVELLALVEGCCEMSLRVSLNAVSPFEWIVSRHADLAQLRDECFGGGNQPGHNEKLRMGRLFEACLVREREAHEQRVLEPLERLSRRILRRPVGKETLLLDAAILVRETARPSLEQGIEKLVGAFGDDLLFSLAGPTPPFSFTNVTEER